jgi:hypothetical protein
MRSMPRDGAGETEGNQAGPGLADSLSPVDLPEPATPLPHGLRWTSIVVSTASLVLLLLNAHAIRDWSYQLPPNAATAPVVTAAETWYDIADGATLNRPVETMHVWWQTARDARFDQGGSPPLADGPGAAGPAIHDNLT